jgi:bifunctional non-homologous end joining protein LigD
MGLREYARKRSFARTPEPAPAKPPRRRTPGRLRFVVHKHQASHLHYDLRLEQAGVLISWAVPKGPSMDPRDKRLAIRVEDHPLDYIGFHGRIPEGQYGAGLVEIWDEGAYEPGPGPGGESGEAAIAAGLAKGHLDLVFHGRRLTGAFTLIHLKGRGPKDNQWLLFKRQEDRPAPSGPRPGSDPPGRASGRAAQRSSASLEALGLSDAPRGPFPGPLEPMLATLVEAPFDRPGWSFEVKWDGFRALAVTEGGRARLVSRAGHSLNDRFPAVAAALAVARFDAVFDGEVVAVDERGRPVFQDLQNARRAGDGRLRYYVFDVLQVDGRDLRPLPLGRRREVLAKVLPVSQTVRISDAVEARGRDFFQAAAANGLEGIVAKDLAASYRPGRRTRAWLKIKARRRQEAVIGGFTRARGSRRYFGALVLGVYRGRDLVYIGHVGTGFDERALKDLDARLKPLVTATPPFASPPRANEPVTWVEPRLVAEVEFGEWTAEGLLRHPVFLGLRDDKPPRQVGREEAVPDPSPAAVRPPRRLRTRAELTHLDKVFWPGEGITKGDVIGYYDEMAGRILPYLKGRPQALNRHPDGIAGPSFFQKNLTQAPPDWVRTVEIASGSGGRPVRYLVCDNRDTLLYEANLGAIEINVWSSSLPRLDEPDYVVLDFDPLETSFGAAVEAVRAAKRVLDEMELPAYCKTSGATGLHVYIPLRPGFGYDQARQLAKLVSLIVNRRHPDLTSLERSPGKRRGRIYLDYLQNRKGATMAAPYALRPVPGATVSMPLDWREVTARLDPAAFDFRTAPERAARREDPWRSFFKSGLDPAKALERIDRWRLESRRR